MGEKVLSLRPRFICVAMCCNSYQTPDWHFL